MISMPSLWFGNLMCLTVHCVSNGAFLRRLEVEREPGNVDRLPGTEEMGQQGIFFDASCWEHLRG